MLRGSPSQSGYLTSGSTCTSGVSVAKVIAAADRSERERCLQLFEP